MAKMMNPELEVVRFENEDVIATSKWFQKRSDGNWYDQDNNPVEIMNYVIKNSNGETYNNYESAPKGYYYGSSHGDGSVYTYRDNGSGQ